MASCKCPEPSSCEYCSRMYPCDCHGCPHKRVTSSARPLSPTAKVRAALDRGETIDPDLILALCDAVDGLARRIEGVERRMRPVGVRRG